MGPEGSGCSGSQTGSSRAKVEDTGQPASSVPALPLETPGLIRGLFLPSQSILIQFEFNQPQPLHPSVSPTPISFGQADTQALLSIHTIQDLGRTRKYSALMPGYGAGRHR